jgi:hypothetical protein
VHREAARIAARVEDEDALVAEEFGERSRAPCAKQAPRDLRERKHGRRT